MQFFVSANNKRKLEEQRTEEFYTSSLEEIPNNGSIADAIIQQYKRRRIKMSNYRNEKYSYELMKFSLTLQGYSRKAYNNVRESFDGALPSESHIPIYSKRLIVLRDSQAANQVIELMLSTKNVSEEKFLFQKLLISTMETVKPEVFSELMTTNLNLRKIKEQK